ncbi:hypothetical protein OBBRIDRAFT_839406 [Obba rivulosa]|uniref:Uncharacterized protein n=1 Tax=Obba rivulosa TaxID=1052685 RepID=A0A8E2DGI4_9APHY|nr:hypothetical protein OBBRIDRAFT_839406 [Obba rivulosa]
MHISAPALSATGCAGFGQTSEEDPRNNTIARCLHAAAPAKVYARPFETCLIPTSRTCSSEDFISLRSTLRERPASTQYLTRVSVTPHTLPAFLAQSSGALQDDWGTGGEAAPACLGTRDRLMLA